MKSMYAVVGQMLISASNYAIFMLLARLLSVSDFIAFSTAVGLNMLAYAIAEGGVSYVAPQELARDNVDTSALAGAFVSIVVTLYVITMIVGFFIWNSFSKDGLNGFWVLAYAIYFIPGLLLPVWITCWSINLFGIITLAVLRLGMVVTLYFYPYANTLIGTGFVFLVFTIVFIMWLNRYTIIISWATKSTLRMAFSYLQKVFLAKTLSYAAYALAPLIIGVVHGNVLASNYVIGERMKSLYTTVFQPVTQTLYLWQVQSTISKLYKRILFFGLNIINIIVCVSLLVAIDMGFLKLLGERFVEVENIDVYALAAFFSVATSLLLYFQVFPLGKYKYFRRATIIQMLTFIVLYIAFAVYPWILPAYVLFIAEVVIFIVICIDLTIDYKKSIV